MLKVAIVGAGRMGSVVARQLPDEVEKLVIDHNEGKARGLAQEIGGSHAAAVTAGNDSDIIVVVLPTPEINQVMEQLSGIAKDGAIIMNMATNGTVEPAIKTKNSTVNIVETKIIGHAMSVNQGAPAYVVAETEDQQILSRIQTILPGFKKVVQGKVDMIPEIVKIGSTEGIRAAITVRKLLKSYKIPKDWEDIIIYTVCAGTMRSYVEDDLGHFARQLAERLEAED